MRAVAFSQVEPARLAVGVVTQVDLDERLLPVDLHCHLDRDPSWHPWKRIVRALRDDAATGELANRRDHLLLGVVEPLAGVGLECVPANLGAELEHPPLTDPGGAE